MLLTAALNPRPTLALRLLTWTSPAMPIGAWIAAMAAGGAVLSAGATALALRDGSSTPEALRRRVHRDDDPEWPEEDAGQPRRGWRPDKVERTQPEWAAPLTGEASRAGPSRQPGQPPPTVAVPFRVIRAPGEPATVRQPQATRSGTRASETVRQEQPAWDNDWGSDHLDAW